MSQNDWAYKPDPWQPADYDEAVIYAVRALKDGLANDGQQKLVWDWLMYVTHQDDWAFRPSNGNADGLRSTDLVLGKQWVGQQFRKMLDWRMTPKAKKAASEHPILEKRRSARAERLKSIEETNKR